MSAATALDALHLARMAWERSQPQMFIDFDALDDRLEAANETGVRGRQPIVERFVVDESPSSGGALASGAGPCCGRTFGAAPAPATADDLVSFPAPSPSTNGGSAADSWTGQRGAPAKGVSHT